MIARFQSRRPVIGAGLAEWAHVRPDEPAPKPPLWTLALPHRLALAVLEVLAERLARAVAALFRVDDQGHVHVHDRFVAACVGVLVGLLVLAFEMVAVSAYNTGYGHGWSAYAEKHWSGR